MTPHEAPVPFGGVREVLVEEVPDAAEEEGAVGVWAREGASFMCCAQ